MLVCTCICVFSLLYKNALEPMPTVRPTAHVTKIAQMAVQKGFETSFLKKQKMIDYRCINFSSVFVNLTSGVKLK